MRIRLRERLTLWGQIFGIFFRIGPSTFGGGYAMIPAIEREIVHKKARLEQSEIAEMISIAGSAPGGMGVNSAAYIGFRKAGTGGAVMAVLGIAAPTLVLVFLLSLLYTQFENQPKIEAALKGIHGAIIALILIAAYKMTKSSLYDKTTVAIATAVTGVLLATKIHPLTVIGLGIAAGMMIAVNAKQWLGMRVCTDKESSVEQARQELQFPEYYI